MRYRSGRIFLYVFLLALKSIQLTFDDQKIKKRGEQRRSYLAIAGVVVPQAIEVRHVKRLPKPILYVA